MQETFGSTCHGAGRARSRNNSRNALSYTQVLESLKTQGIAIRQAVLAVTIKPFLRSQLPCFASQASA